MSQLPTQPLSRRDFLKLSGTGLGAAVLMARQAYVAQASDASNDVEPWGILVDLTRCTGCNSCALACQNCNQNLQPQTPPQQLDSNAYTYVAECETVDTAGFNSTQYVKRQCMHCLDPACVSACTVGALQKTPEGPVIYEADRCIGCRYCQYACPFGVPTYEWENALGLIHKCQMCVTRLDQGNRPACVEACPSGALRFDTRPALLAQARARIESNPERYLDHIYGEHEAGGTSVLYLSGVPFAELGFPTLGEEPIPHYAEFVMKQTPVIALTVASIATSLYWLTRRRAHAEIQMEVEQS